LDVVGRQALEGIKQVDHLRGQKVELGFASEQLEPSPPTDQPVPPSEEDLLKWGVIAGMVEDQRRRCPPRVGAVPGHCNSLRLDDDAEPAPAEFERHIAGSTAIGQADRRIRAAYSSRQPTLSV
jgi:hypothetical protein